MRIAAVAASALLYAALFPPWGYSRYALVVLTPLALALRGLSVPRATLAGLLWGVVAIWGFGHWVPEALATYWSQSHSFGVLLAAIGSVVFMGTYTAGFGACAAVIDRAYHGTARVLLLSVAWVAWESARGRLLSGDPWLLLGYAFGDDPTLSQSAALGSVYLLSFLIALGSFTLAEMFTANGPARRLRIAFPFLVGIVAAVAYGFLIREPSAVPTNAVRVRIVQANNDPGASWRPELYGAGLDRYIELTRQPSAAPPAVVIWPESALTFFVERESALTNRVQQLARDIHADLIVGAPRVSEADPARLAYFNSAYHFAADGELTGRYDKTHLLPFGEYFPLRTIQFLRRNFERVRTFTPGTAPVLMDTPLGKAAIVICFEAIFPELVRERMANGGEILLNLSNDAWLGNDAGPRQHELMVRMRAIETRSWVVRATTTGVSSIIDPFGRVVAHTELGEAAVLDAQVAPRQQQTMYERTGDVVPISCVVVTTVALLVARRRRRAGH